MLTINMIGYTFLQLIAKTINFLIKLLNLGAGGTWPGHVALKLYPAVFRKYSARNKVKYIFVSGTNGKTTTCKLISHMLSAKGYRVMSNKSGANLLNGIVSAVLVQQPLFKNNYFDYAVFETDEFTLPLVLEQSSPFMVLLLNLSRDQLDRYGEIDAVLKKWSRAVALLDSSVVLITDSTQTYFDPVIKAFKGSVFHFDANDAGLNHTKLIGDFNAKNVNAALLAVSHAGISQEEGLRFLNDFGSAYGRGEFVNYADKSFRIFLAKNPTSFNSNLDLLLNQNINPDTVLFLLNDDPRDGRDVSWIYDIEADKLTKACEGKKIFVSGSRSTDFALRLHYARVDVSEARVSGDIRRIIADIVGDADTKEILVLPNYSSMLEIRKILTGRSIL